MPSELTWDDVVTVANNIGVDPCVIDAIGQKESRGSGFLNSGRPKTLFEGHWFYKRLKAYGINPDLLMNEHPSIIYPKWTNKHYGNSRIELARLEEAKTIHQYAALESASWGKYQIMGFNYKVCGYVDVVDFVNAQCESEQKQLDCLIKFLVGNNLLQALKNKDWAKIARVYNGPQYAKNNYDVDLSKLYNKCKARQ